MVIMEIWANYENDVWYSSLIHEAILSHYNLWITNSLTVSLLLALRVFKERVSSIS